MGYRTLSWWGKSGSLPGCSGDSKWVMAQFTMAFGPPTRVGLPARRIHWERDPWMRPPAPNRLAAMRFMQGVLGATIPGFANLLFAMDPSARSKIRLMGRTCGDWRSEMTVKSSRVSIDAVRKLNQSGSGKANHLPQPLFFVSQSWETRRGSLALLRKTH